MTTLKIIADILTGSRFIVALVLSWLGWAQGIDGWYQATMLLIYSWTSDVLDGILARRSKSSLQTWIGRNDLYLDMLVALSLLVFMTLSSTINLSMSIIYSLIWILIFARFGFLSALGKIFQAPIYAWFIMVTFQYDLLLGGFILFFIVLIVVVTWPRFPNDTVPKFISGFVDNET